MGEAELRRALGKTAAVFGLLHLAPVAFVWLSSGGPAPILLSARAWSLFFYSHFIAFTATGFGLQALAAWKTKVFHGGPMIDFLIVVGVFMMAESGAGFALKPGTGPSWPALLPGTVLIGVGLRLMTGRPFFHVEDDPN